MHASMIDTRFLIYKFACHKLYGNTLLFSQNEKSDEKYGWTGCRASSLDAPGDAKRSRRLRTVDYSKPGGEAPFSVPTMSGMAGRSLSSALTMLAAFPAWCFLPLAPC